MPLGFRMILVNTQDEGSVQTVDTKRRLDSFTKEGGFVVVANSLMYVANPLKQAVSLLNARREVPAAELNSLLVVSIVMLLSTLDYIASVVEMHTSTSDASIKIYFSEYPFSQREFLWIKDHQKVIRNMTYDDRSLIPYLHSIKHETPWIGLPSLDTRNDLYDIEDGDGKRFVYDVMIPAYDVVKTIIVRLANNHFHENVPRYPSF
jgi:hypothetical protein